jgi:hypothetical protein
MDLMQPHMPPVALEALHSGLTRTSTFLEFGTGGRPEYHLVESALRPIALHDHMAEFRVEHNMNVPMIVALLFKNLHVLD